MTIQEAIKSGKPFKRKNWRRWRIIQTINTRVQIRVYEYPAYMGGTPSIRIEDILATDWEIKQ